MQISIHYFINDDHWFPCGPVQEKPVMEYVIDLCISFIINYEKLVFCD